MDNGGAATVTENPITKSARPPRTRLTYSCETCRVRKLRCNREQPCARCLRSSNPEKCTYRSTKLSAQGEHAGNNGTTNSAAQPPGNDEGQSPSEVLYLAKRAKRQNSNLDATSDSTPPWKPNLKNKFSANPTFKTVRGRNYTTRYYGQSHMVGSLTDFQDLREYASKFSSLHGEMAFLRTRFQRASSYYKIQSREKCLAKLSEMSDPNCLYSYLPDSTTTQTDLLLRYASKFETTYRILHIPALMKVIGAEPSTSKLTPSVTTAQLLLVCVIGAGSREAEASEFTGESTPTRDRVVEAVRVVDLWLRAHRPKRPDFEVLQVYALIVLAKKIHSIDVSQIWASTCEIISYAKSMGMHRDPNHWMKMTPYAAEMRRRLWATILELHIMASVERGMTPCIRPDEYDCQLPSNIDDDQLQEDMTSVPKPKPHKTFTSSSIQLLLCRSQEFRLGLIQLINSPRWDMTLKEAMELESKIAEYRSLFMEDKDVLQEVAEFAEDGTPHICPYASVILLHLRLCSLLVFQPFFLSADATNSSFERRTCVEIASAIIEQSCEYLNSGDAILFLVPVSMVVRSALYLCQETVHAAAANGTPNSAPSPLNYIRTSRLAAVGAAIEIVKKSIFTVGRGMRDFKFLSLALAFARSRNGGPEEEEEVMQEVWENLLAVCQRWLERQRPFEDDYQYNDVEVADGCGADKEQQEIKAQDLEGLENLDFSIFASWIPEVMWNFDGGQSLELA